MPPGFGKSEPTKPGPKISPADVESYPDEPLYTDKVVRTLFIDFEESDWEQVMQDFYRTDVDVPATLTVDGVVYPEVGVHFRGLSSFGMVREGQKRSLNLSMDHGKPGQKLYGRKTLNLLNAHEDPSFLHTVLYLESARKYTPAPQANFVHVVINGESWGLYTNAEQFNKEFLEEHFGASSGSRWKVNGSPMGRGGLEYLGDNTADYKRIYSIKSKDTEEAWEALSELCRILNETPASELPEKIEKVLDVEGALKFLALEVALINSDGYWTRASDYSLYRDKKGLFHIIIHDANETFGPPAGPAMRMNGGPPRGMLQDALLGMVGGQPKVSGVHLDPLVGLTDSSKPLRSKLLAVPKYQERYLELMKQINREVLDWDKLKERVDQHVRLIDPLVKADTRKLSSYEDFRKAVNTETMANPSESEDTPKAAPGPGRMEMSLQEFARQRHAFLESKLGL
jgi:spore coat protein CotH